MDTNDTSDTSVMSDASDASVEKTQVSLETLVKKFHFFIGTYSLVTTPKL